MPKPTTYLFEDVERWTHAPPKKAAIMPVANNAPELERAQRDYRILLRRAEMFWLEDEYTRASMAASRNMQWVEKISNLARLPYDVTWMEFDCKQRVLASMDAGTLADMDAPLDNVPDRMGFLLQTLDETTGVWLMTVFSDGAGEIGRVGPHSVQYILAPEGPSPLVIAPPKPWGFVGTRELVPQDVLDSAHMALGVTHKDLKGRQYKVVVPAFENRIGIIIERFNRDEILCLDLKKNSHESVEHHAKIAQQLFAAHLQEEAGMVRWVITILAMMAAAPNTKHFSAMPSHPRPASGVKKPFMAFTNVTLTLPKTKAVAIIHRAVLRTSSERARNRRHRFRGHFRAVEYGKQPPFPCKHLETILENGAGICPVCRRKVRWKPPGERGDASLGYVKHSYTVEAA